MGAPRLDVVVEFPHEATRASELLEMLEEWRQQVLSGELVSIALVGCLRDGGTQSEACDGYSFARMIGAIETLKFKLMANQHSVPGDY